MPKRQYWGPRPGKAFLDLADETLGKQLARLQLVSRGRTQDEREAVVMGLGNGSDSVLLVAFESQLGEDEAGVEIATAQLKAATRLIEARGGVLHERGEREVGGEEHDVADAYGGGGEERRHAKRGEGVEEEAGAHRVSEDVHGADALLVQAG